MEFISAHQHKRVGADGLKWGVESMCAVLNEYGVTIAPSTYYAHRARRGPSKADWADAAVIDAIWQLRRSQRLYRVLGARKTWIVLRTNGIDVSRCVVERVMREMGWRGACKRRRVRTTVADPAATRAPDRVARRFVAECTRSVMGCRFHVLPHPGRLGLHGVRDRCLCPQDRGLEGGHRDDPETGDRCDQSRYRLPENVLVQPLWLI